jgi:hypothetical protein
MRPTQVKCIVFFPVLIPLAGPVGAAYGFFFTVTPTVLGNDYPDQPITLLTSTVTSIRVSIYKLKGDAMNLDIAIVHFIADIIVALVPAHPESSRYVPLLALNLIAYLFIAYA